MILLPGETPTEPVAITVSPNPKATVVLENTANFVQLPILTLTLVELAVRLTKPPSVKENEVVANARPIDSDDNDDNDV